MILDNVRETQKIRSLMQDAGKRLIEQSSSTSDVYQLISSSMTVVDAFLGDLDSFQESYFALEDKASGRI